MQLSEYIESQANYRKSSITVPPASVTSMEAHDEHEANEQGGNIETPEQAPVQAPPTVPTTSVPPTSNSQPAPPPLTPIELPSPAQPLRSNAWKIKMRLLKRRSLKPYNKVPLPSISCLLELRESIASPPIYNSSDYSIPSLSDPLSVCTDLSADWLNTNWTYANQWKTASWQNANQYSTTSPIPSPDWWNASCVNAPQSTVTQHGVSNTVS